jgi:hypothetical protein
MPGCNCQLQIVICLFLTWNDLHSVYLAILKLSVHMNIIATLEYTVKNTYEINFCVVDGHLKQISASQRNPAKAAGIPLTVAKTPQAAGSSETASAVTDRNV